MLQVFVDKIQDWPLIDRFAEPVQQWVAGELRTMPAHRAVDEFLSGSWIGHPLHAILKDVPIGAWTMTVVFDALQQRKADPSLERAADISLRVGLVGALASALTGFADWSKTSGRPRRIGAAHAALNIGATLTFGASLCARRVRRAAGINLALGAYSLLMLGGYLGGHLVFDNRVGVKDAEISS